MPKELTHKQIINKLKEDKHYYGEFGRQYISNSDIKTLLAEPAQFRSHVKDNENLAKGRLFHQLILQPDLAKDFPIVDVKTRGNEYKEFLKDKGLEFALKTSEADEIKEMVDWFMDKKNPKTIALKEYLFDFGAKYEVPMIKELHKNVMFKGKADCISRDMIIDLKTTSTDLNKFANNASYYYYDSQAYIYQKLFTMPMVFFVIGKQKKQYGTTNEDYYDVGVFNVSPEFIAQGKEKVQHAMLHYEKYFSPKAEAKIEDIVLQSTL
tara:strand:- start:3676 stop:4473 length:798 start_codon:yes stop_codon:yes gene_type:complete